MDVSISMMGARARRLRMALCLLAAGSSISPALADRIITTNGHTLEGLIREENEFQVRIDVRGVEVPIPRERIQQLTKNTLDENARTLLDRAFESLSRDDIPTARTLVEQARSLNSSTTQIVDDLNRLDKQIADLERRGGTPEDRRVRAETMLRRAVEEFDQIKNAEGNLLLIQALQIDPTYEAAQKLIEEKLGSSTHPDLQLAAEYFGDVMWPDNVRADSVVLPLLPQAYVDLSNLFEQTRDVRKAQHYAELMITMAEAFRKNPDWLRAAPAEVRAVVNQPVISLLIKKIDNNLKEGDYVFGLLKMEGWSSPTDSEEMAALYTRVYVGSGQYDKAQETLKTSMETFPANNVFKPNANALELLQAARTAATSGDNAAAIENFHKVFDNRTGLLPEIVETAGNQLSKLKLQDMEASVGKEPRWQAPDLGALVMVYSKIPNERYRAAAILNESIQTLPWKLRTRWYINGSELPALDGLTSTTQAAVAPTLAVYFDDSSPFEVELLVNAVTDSAKGQAALQALSTSPPTALAEPLQVTAVGFKLEARHPVLGSLLSKAWEVTAIPPNDVPGRQARGEQLIPEAPIHILLASDESLRQFIANDMSHYISSDVAYLASRVEIPLMSQLLQEAARAGAK